MDVLLKYTICILLFSQIFEASCSRVYNILSANKATEGEPEPAPRFTADKDVKFLLYTRKNPKEAQSISIGNLTSLGNFNAQHETNIIVHGWRSSPSKFDECLSGYLSAGDNNVILVDWSKGASNVIYAIPRAEVVPVGEYVAKLLDFLVEQGLSISKIHLVGHSLGGHIVGVAGNRFQHGKVGRITGLDPAGPLFGIESSSDRLDPSDADFVDVIHTCAGSLGWRDPIGDADFYPNGGSMVQPGCGNDIAELGMGSCSHERSVLFFAESITTKTGFVAVQCSDWDKYKSGNCSQNSKALMGEGATASAKGKYYLKTASSSPFAEG